MLYVCTLITKVLLFPVRKIIFFLSLAWVPGTCLKALDFSCYYETSIWSYNFSYHQSVCAIGLSVSSFWFSKENVHIPMYDVRCFWATHVSSGYLWSFFLRYSKNLLYITDTEPSLEGENINLEGFFTFQSRYDSLIQNVTNKCIKICVFCMITRYVVV